jgi:hypothetical protein
MIAAAIITVAIHPWSSGSGQPPGPQVAISSISYPVVDGTRVIAVTGTVRDLGAGEHVYAFAGRQAGLPPWYPGGPAAISSGLWSTRITDLPASGGDFSVWAGLASPPPACQGVGCTGAALVRQKHELALAGPHAVLLKRVTRPRHAALPAARR